MDYKCDNCGRVADEEDLPLAEDLSMRLTPGYPYTDRECAVSECGALCYPVDRDALLR